MIGDYFFDLIEFFLDLVMLVAQLGMAAGLEVLFLINQILPDNVCQGQSKFVPVWRSKSVPLGLKNIGY
jgi:hypothetical protein